MSGTKTGRGWLLAGALLAGVLPGCGGAPGTGVVPEAPAIVLAPPPAPPPPPPGAASAATVAREAAALRRLATRYVVRRDANPAVIDRLSTLTLQARRAVERMQATRTRSGFRPADVAAARAAADTLAAFLQTEAKPVPVADPAPALPPGEAPPSEAHP